MADYTLKRNDTYPPLKGKALDSQGLLEIKEADKIKLLFKMSGKTVITGTPAVIDPPETDPDDPEGPGFNWEYKWAAEDTKEEGTYEVELEITWDEAAEPDAIESIPNGPNPTLEILPDLG